MERFIVFKNNNQQLAININNVEKIIEYQIPSQVPESVDFLIGVIQVDDRILPIINTSKKLYDVESTYDEDDKVLVVRWRDKFLGLAVNEVIGIHGFDDESIEKSQLNTDIAKEYIVGFIKGDTITTILDTDKIFDKEQAKEILKATDISDDVAGDSQ